MWEKSMAKNVLQRVYNNSIPQMKTKPEEWNRLKGKDADVVLFECTELLCQIAERFKDQRKSLPSKEEVARLFKIAMKNYPKAFCLSKITLSSYKQ